jgi:hypothetical protein
MPGGVGVWRSRGIYHRVSRSPRNRLAGSPAAAGRRRPGSFRLLLLRRVVHPGSVSGPVRDIPGRRRIQEPARRPALRVHQPNRRRAVDRGIVGKRPAVRRPGGTSRERALRCHRRRIRPLTFADPNFVRAGTRVASSVLGSTLGRSGVTGVPANQGYDLT